MSSRAMVGALAALAAAQMLGGPSVDLTRSQRKGSKPPRPERRLKDRSKKQYLLKGIRP